jgi:single-strand DNA-binding protein
MVNKIILVGRVGTDPEVTNINNGSLLAKFSFATSETHKNKNGEKITTTIWHNIVTWNKMAEVVEKYVKKGDLLYIEGKQVNRNYEDNEGSKKYTSEVYAENFQMMGGKKDTDNRN